MARTFGGAATDVVSVAEYAAINSLTTMSIALWGYRTGTGGGSAGRMLERSTGLWRLFSDGTNNSFNDQRWPTRGNWQWTATSANVWAHEVLTYDAGSTANNPVVYVNGSSVTVNRIEAPSGTWVGDTGSVHIGNNSSGNRNFAGRLAEVALWNVILNANEAAALSRGVSPRYVRPGSLVLYLPVFGVGTPEPNFGSYANTGTVTGTVRANHAPITLWTPKWTAFVEAAAAGGLSIPVAMHTYRRRRVA